MRFLLFLPLLYASAFASEPSYVGSATCSQCHRNVALLQSKSSMARTWQGAAAFPSDYQRVKQEGGIQYRFARKGDSIEYDVRIPGRPVLRGDAESMVGGQRHGLSFLVRLTALDGTPLERAPLIEARYLHYSPTGNLVLSPGFPEHTPASWETALGRVLSPGFEEKCLQCHGASEKGVRCETCHGAGSEHLKAVGAKLPNKAILNPGRLTNPQKLEQCGRCHSGFGEIYDPVPDDVLISNQVTALKSSQCYIQSGAGLSCTSCHNPHHDASKDDQASVAACLSCHSPKVQNRAALCPVNKKGECLKCHMPESQKGAFHMVDHWIRVHPEQGIKAATHDSTDRTRVSPKRLNLRWIVADRAQQAEAARRELVAGAPFFAVAQKYSTDKSAISGGFLGDMAVVDMEPSLAKAALQLQRGEFSPVVDLRNKPVILYRMPRDFLLEAEQLQLEATRLRESRSFGPAAKKYLESLQIYPYYLRSLIFLAVSVGEQGDGARAAAILELAASLYPKDPAVQYNLGIAYNSLGRVEDEVRVYRRAIDLQADLIPAYLNLGGTLYAAGRLDDAAETYRSGLRQNPLAATLYFNLAQVYLQQGKAAEAARAVALAGKIDPKFANESK